MGAVKDSSCLGQYYQDSKDQCDVCPLVFLCIDATMAADDEYWDGLANRQQEIEEMENDPMWTSRMRLS